MPEPPVPAPSDEALIERVAEAIAWADSPDPGGHGPLDVYRPFARAALAVIDLPGVRAEAQAARTAEIVTFLRARSGYYRTGLPRGEAMASALLLAADAINARFNPEAER